jgi:uncharacterized protein (UPF0216 family)
MLNESAMEKWFKFEMSKVNSGIVINKKPLSELVLEDKPKTETRDGSVFYFNKDAISKLQGTLPTDMHSLKLPISFYTSLDVAGSAYIADKPSFMALKAMGEFPKVAELVEGKYWLSKILVTDMIKRWPTLIQFVRY